MPNDDEFRQLGARDSNHSAAYLTVVVFLAGFGGMIWAIGSAIGLF